MDNKEIERIALEVAKEVTPEFVWEEGCGHESGVCKYELYEFATKLIAAVDAERGKDAVGVLCISHFRDCPSMETLDFQPMQILPPGQYQLFLHPTIPEGMAQRSAVIDECALLCDALAAKAEGAARDGGLYSEDFASAYEFAAVEIRKLATGVTK